MSNTLLEFIDQELADQLDVKEDAHEIERRKVLLEYIDKEIGDFAVLMEGRGEENFDIQAAYDSIPLPTLSEMGWADPSKKGGEIQDGARRELAEYLAPVAGKSATLQEAVQDLQAHMEVTLSLPKEDLELIPVSTLLSFLVFYKTLTHIIANFNSATAGFLFEALLGVLTGGKQIPAKGAGGGDTIADFKYVTGAKGKGTARWVSLKLLTEKGTTIDGSFRDLINDLADPKKEGGIEYVVVLKDLEGGKDDLAGSLKFYSFFLNRSTLKQFLSTSKQGTKDLQIADKRAMEMLSDDPSGLTRHDGTFFEWLTEFLNNLDYMTTAKEKKTLKSATEDVVNLWMGEWNKLVGELSKFADWDEKSKSYIAKKEKDIAKVQDLEDAYYTDFEDGGLPKTERQVRKIAKDPSLLGTIGTDEFGGKRGDKLNKIFKPLLVALRAMYVDKEGSDKKKIVDPKTGKKVSNPQWRPDKEEEYAGRVKSIKLPGDGKKGKFTYMSPEQSWAYLQTIESDEEYWDTIKKYSFGFLNKKQFVITQDEMKKLVGDPFGTLSVGKVLIREALVDMIDGVNRRMFTIFRTMGELSAHLRTFFMKDMEPEAGEQAKLSARAVASDTQKLITTSKKQRR
jgi:hypothetical protein